MRKNLKYMITTWRGLDNKNFYKCMFYSPISVLLPIVIALIPKLILDAIEKSISTNYMLILVAIITLALVVLNCIEPYFKGQIMKAYELNNLHHSVEAFRKLTSLSYSKLESGDGRETYERAKAFCCMDANPNSISSGEISECTASLITSCVGIISYISIFVFFQPLLILVILLTSVLEAFLVIKSEKNINNYNNERASIGTKIKYFYYTAIQPNAGKDIRIYSLKDWLSYYIAKLALIQSSIHKKIMRTTTHLTAFQSLGIFIRDSFAYGFLIYSVIVKTISISDFIFFLGLLIGFSAMITEFFHELGMLKRLDYECTAYLKFINLDNETETNKKKLVKIESIELRNLSFSYPGSNNLILDNINLFLTKKERLAIVGENGSGKTTLVKLLCGLYKPTAGEIFINGINLNEYAENDYLNRISTVFQDYHFFPLTIQENISLKSKENTDINKLNYVLNKAGIFEKINTLRDGVDTHMIREVWEDAADFSGGEKQKLLLARALYKDSDVLILDEPTAALDAIAENNMYLNYKEFAENKLSVFISHRLASTRFCDRIILLSEGKILEEGDHNKLLSNGGEYWRMFETQANYYKRKEDV